MRTCTICRHRERPAIEADLRAGLPYREVARRHDVSEHALWRHWANHEPLHSATPLATVAKVMALLKQAETSAAFNDCLLRVQEAGRSMNELMMQLNHGIER
jgi:hypothetical protein